MTILCCVYNSFADHIVSAVAPVVPMTILQFPCYYSSGWNGVIHCLSFVFTKHADMFVSLY